MVIAITILATLLVISILFLASAIIHISKINRELDQISDEQSNQNSDLQKLIYHVNSHAEAINILDGNVKSINEYIVETANKKLLENVRSYSGNVGEA